jgi:hypothetical protein
MAARVLLDPHARLSTPHAHIHLSLSLILGGFLPNSGEWIQQRHGLFSPLSFLDDLLSNSNERIR